MRRISGVIAVLLGGVAAPGVMAQTMTTAADVKPILQATKPQWIAVREYDGQDLLYFTNLLAWRCGVNEVRYGVNGAAPAEVLAMEPCYEGEAAPNALKMPEGSTLYITLPLGSVQTVTVDVQFDDGTAETGQYDRTAVLTP